MNTLEPVSENIIEAKIIGKTRDRNIIYAFVDPLNNYFLKRNEIFLAQIAACKKLSSEHNHKEDISLINNEILDLQTFIK